MDIPIGPLAKVLAMVALALPFFAACRGAVPAAPGRADALFAGLVAADGPGAALLVVKDGRAVLQRGRGIRDLRTGRPIEAGTNFRLASVTKQFTAAAIMLLVRDGRLRYEDRLTDLLPDFPAYGRDITVRHLLNHTSGLADYEDLMSPPDPSLPIEEQQIREAGVLELLKREKSGQFAPGSRWAYSNSGYVLLGVLVEKVSGRTFPAFLRERIFVPLGMTNTMAHVRGRDEVADRAYGHAKTNGGWLEADQSPTSATLGDGGVYSSIADLARWDEALRGHALLSEAEMRPALDPVVVPAGTTTAYGFGWFLDPWRGHARMWHYGETVGFRTAIQRFPADGLTVVVLANRDDLDAAGLALQVAGCFLGTGK